MKYRPHRGLLDEAMSEVIDLPDRAALLAHLNKEMGMWLIILEDEDLKVEPYGFDDRIGWNTHLVSIKNKKLQSGTWFFSAMPHDFFGAFGFTDGPA